jgi:putative transposase
MKVILILVPTLCVETHSSTLCVECDMSRDRYRIFDTIYPHFLTCTVVGWLPVFTRPECVEIVLDSWRFLQKAERMTLLGYVVLENHLHFVATSENLAKQVGDFKSFTARKIIDWLESHGENSLLAQLQREKALHKADRQYQLWQEGSHPKQITTDEMMLQKLEYMHYNPVKRGYVDDPIHWRYSSARNYAGQPGLIQIATDWK